MKRFTVLSIIATIVATAWACGGWVRPNYYMFSVFDRNLMNDNIQSQALQYWVDYTGDESAPFQAEYLGFVKPGDFDKSDNLLIATARKKGDSETLAYLRTLVNYLNNNGSGDNEWDYPSKAELVHRGNVIGKVKQQALAYKGSRYREQYALLVMRCNMVNKDHAANIAYWQSTASKFKSNSAYCRWMKDLYAGALYNTGRRDQAAEIYAELGDMTSIKYCVRKKRNLAGIKEEYKANPNSPTLIFLVQDFVNNTQETLDNGSDPEVMQYVEATGIYEKDAKAFIAFAGQVLKEGKTKSPAMWEAARGFENFMLGNSNDAIKQLTAATNMNGTERMKDNARACLMLARATAVKDYPGDSYLATLRADYRWLEEKAQIGNDGEARDPHYIDVADRLTHSVVVPQLNGWGMDARATALCAKINQWTLNGAEYDEAINNFSSSQLEGYYNYVSNADRMTEFDRWIATANTVNANEYNDLMGTKLTREGEFAAAIPYLEKVPLSLIGEQSIGYYMAAKDYNTVIWEKRQFMSPWKWEQTPVKRNAKLDYCRDMVALDKAIAAAKGEKLNQLLLRKAALLYQASYKGDCWYITRYGHSVYDEKMDSEFDFVGTAYTLLTTVEEATTDPLTQLKARFARAFVTGETEGYCLERNYDWSTDKWSYSLDPDATHNEEMGALLELTNSYRGTLPAYVSKCDYLKQFRKLTAGR